MTLAQSGNVGIGTMSPAGRLEIKSASTDSDPLVVERSSNTTNIFEIREGSTGAGNLYLYDAGGAQVISMAAAGDVVFNHAGNVGIGTTSPTTKLQVVDTLDVSSGDHTLVDFNAGTSFGQPQFTFGYHGTGAAVDTIFLRSGNNVNLALGTSGVYPPAFNIMYGAGPTGEKVGIGTMSPAGRFHVSTGGDGNALVVDDATGYVGIGTTSPQYDLDVQGENGLLRVKGENVT